MDFAQSQPRGVVIGCPEEDRENRPDQEKPEHGSVHRVRRKEMRRSNKAPEYRIRCVAGCKGTDELVYTALAGFLSGMAAMEEKKTNIVAGVRGTYPLDMAHGPEIHGCLGQP